MVTVGPDALEPFPRFSLYNSPYAAHDAGCAVDLYPQRGDWRADHERGTRAPSPVSGEVVETLSVAAPPKPYAAERDHLVVVDVGDHLARILHVDPAVEPGDVVAVGDPLGRTVRSGFFAPWVDDHLHLGFRPKDADPYRASGSLPVDVGVEVAGVPWDGTGTVLARGDTYVVLDAPDHPDPGERFAGIQCDRGGVLDGGLPHYDPGGVLGVDRPDGPVALAGQRVGTVRGRTTAWDEVTVRANGTRVTGLSLFVARERLGAKLICPDASFEPGTSVEVAVEPSG